MCIIRVGGERFEFLAVTLHGRTHPHAGDFWDGNWVRATVEVAAGGFRGEASGDLRSEEFPSFHRGLVGLVESLSGGATFSTLEEWLSIDVSGDGRGHVELSCEVGQLFGGQRLAFVLALDQTDLRPMLDQLARAMAEFPVVGSP